jgi:hypothetical protein
MTINRREFITGGATVSLALPHGVTAPPSVGPAAESWPAELDALVAAPNHHRLLFENDAVRVLDTRIAPGDRTPLHTHRWPSVLYVLSAAPFIRYDAAGKVLLDTRNAPAPASLPMTLWSPALPEHALENAGTTEIHVISVEIKRAEA